MTKKSTGGSTPLKNVEFSVLLALCETPNHGYSLVQRIETESSGRLRLLPGNLYAVLRRLELAGLIRETAPPADQSDQRRRTYSITPAGKRRLADETRGLEQQLTLARQRLGAVEKGTS